MIGVEYRYRASSTDRTRYVGPAPGTGSGGGGGGTTPPPTAWDPSQTVRNKPRIRAADDPGYVDWETYYTSADRSTVGGVSVVDIQAVCNRVPPGPTGHTMRAMSMPADSFVFNDFVNGYYDGLRLANGGAVNVYALSGSGFDNTIIRPRKNSATRDKYRTSTGGHPYAPRGIAGNSIAISKAPGAFVENLSLKGDTQQVTLDGVALDLGYNGLVFTDCPGSRCSAGLRGASPGWANNPPGETFGVAFSGSSHDSILIDFEIDGRDDAGNRVCASPFGWNGSGGGGTATDGTAVLANQGVGATFIRNAQVIRGLVDLGVAGMSTWWITDGIYTEDLWAFSTGSGGSGQTGHGLNHEMWRGNVKHVRPRLFIWNAESAGILPPPPLPNVPHTSNGGMHLSVTTTVPVDQLGTFQVIEPVWDKAWTGSGILLYRAPDLYSGYHNTANDGPAPVITKNGVVLQEKNHPLSGWNTADPALYYAHIH